MEVSINKVHILARWNQDHFDYSIIQREPQWHLDLFSTILSRKYSYHKRVGKQLYVKTRKENKSEKI